MVHLGKLESLNGLVENGSRPHAARVDLCGSEGPVNGSSCVPWTLRAASVFLWGHVLLASSSFLSAVQCPVNRPFQVSRFRAALSPPPSCSPPHQSGFGVVATCSFSSAKPGLHPARGLLSPYLCSSGVHHSCCLLPPLAPHPGLVHFQDW